MASETTNNTRGRRITVVGHVLSDKMDKTITVGEERMKPHPRYGKYVRRTTKYKAHDENNEANMGDVVEIAFTRPLSKSKSWRLVRIVRRNRLAGIEGGEA